MPAELFRNLLATPITLTVAYTSGGNTLTVSSAAQFDITPATYRVAIGNPSKTVWRVDSISGSVLTGGAEANDGNASIGDTVIVVASRAEAERMVQSPNTAEIYGLTGTNGLQRIGPLRRITYPVTADFAWGNQGAASIDTTFGFTRLTSPSTSTNIRRRGKSAPGTPYIVDAVIQYKDSGSASRYGGLFFRESSTSKLHLFQFMSTTNQFQIVNFTNDTTFSSNPANATLEGSLLGSLAPFYIRIRDNGTNLLFTASRDGLYYFTELSVGRTSFMAGAPNEIGFFGNVDSSAGVFEEDIFHWAES
jgi:hypothetical protein